VAWTTPRTWAAGDVPTASTGSPALNAQVRDNMLVLKTPIDDNGKFRALTSSYLADLSGANLTGVGYLAASSTYTAGNQDFGAGGGSRIRLPVGTDKFAGSAGNKTAGSAWVEGDDLHVVASTQHEWYYTGTSLGSPAGALTGSCWVDTDDLVHYVDASGVERSVAAAASHVDTAARSGSAWVDTDSHLHWVGTSGQEWDGHTDVAAHSDSHSDVAHSDVAHDDTHGDVAHSDAHGDDAHSDSHSDVAHSDVAHSDFHLDNASPHADTHGDLAHSDVTHSDSHVDSAHNDFHNDTAHTDDHSDVAHSDSHTDSHGDHTDTHGDQPTDLGT